MQTDNVAQTAYLGPPASFSHAAALEALPSTKPVPLPSFNAILAALQNKPDEYSFGVLPVENSTNGAVVQALDLLGRCGLNLGQKQEQFDDVEVAGEWYLQVHHCLFVTKESFEKAKSGLPSTEASPGLDDLLKKLDIKTLYSHPQVWGQCGQFLGKHFPPALVERVDVSSTSAAAAFVAKHDGESNAETGTMGAISSSLAGEKNNLVCLAENIEDNPGENTTRFLILRNRHSELPLPDFGLNLAPGIIHVSEQKPIFFKSLITFTIPHRTPGTLATALDVFSKHELNLTAIQSRPSKLRNWHYIFFVECQHSVYQAGLSVSKNKSNEKTKKGIERIEKVIEELKQCTEKVRWVGTWKDMLVPT